MKITAHLFRFGSNQHRATGRRVKNSPAHFHRYGSNHNITGAGMGMERRRKRCPLWKRLIQPNWGAERAGGWGGGGVRWGLKIPSNPTLFLFPHYRSTNTWPRAGGGGRNPGPFLSPIHTAKLQKMPVDVTNGGFIKSFDLPPTKTVDITRAMPLATRNNSTSLPPDQQLS